MEKLEKRKSEYKGYGLWYYHMILDRLPGRLLLNNRQECIGVMNATAIAQYVFHVSIIQLDWMHNHGHLVIWAEGGNACNCFYYLKRRLNAQLIKDGFPPLPDEWFFMLRRLDTLDDLVNAVSYSGRNAYDTRKDILPSGHLWSSNYMLFSDISELFEYRTVGEIGPRKMREILGSRVLLPAEYKVGKLGYILPESYVMKVGQGARTKAESLYRDSKDYAYRIFRDYDTYRRLATDLEEVWTPSGTDVDTILFNELNFNYGVKNVSGLNAARRCDLAVTLGSRYGLGPDQIAAHLGMSTSAVAKLLYAHTKKK